MTGLFSALADWRERRNIFRELRRQQADDHERNSFKVRDELEEALSTLALNDRHKATMIWTKLLERYPREVREAPRALDVLLKLNRYDEAEVMMREGAKRHPRDVFFIMALANIAVTRGDYDAAIKYSAELRKRWPGVPQGFIMGAQALIAKDRTEEAEALLKPAMQQFPNEIGCFLEYARIAVRAKDWEEALRRWAIIKDAFRDRPFGVSGMAQALIELRRYDEAEETLFAARVRFPVESGIQSALARCAQIRGDFPEAVLRWRRRIERFPMEMHGYPEAAIALTAMGEFGEAEAIYRAAVERFPSEEAPLILLAKFLHEQKNHAAEAEAWADLRRNFPENDESYTRGADALRRAGRQQEADAVREEYESRPRR